jgi:DnaJ-class molecular chaperone
MKDLYEVLAISRDAGNDVINKAYKSMAFKYHPDKNAGNDGAIFHDISEAYGILSDPGKRRIYDKFGYDCVQNDCPHDIGALDLFSSLFNVDFNTVGEGMTGNIFVFSDLSSLGPSLGLKDPFSNMKHKMTYNLDVTIDELYEGTQKDFRVPSNTISGKTSTKYIINIKKGSKNGDHIIVKEGGNYIPDQGITEDLIIQVNELESDTWRRNGNDLFIEEDITLCEALTGVRINIAHLSGPLHVQISDIVKPNQMFKVLGKGMPIKTAVNSLSDGSNRDYGDMIIDLKIIFPEYLSPDDVTSLMGILGSESSIRGTDDPSSTLSVQAYYYKDKDDVVKELMNDEEESGGCIQQ